MYNLLERIEGKCLRLKKTELKICSIVCALAVMLAAFNIPAFADDTVETVFHVRSDIEGESVSLGDTVSFHVDVSDCPAIVAGSLCARVSASLDFVSASFCGEETPADPADEPNAGAYVIEILDPGSEMTGFISDFCVFIFRVTGLEDISFEFYAYQCIISEYTEISYSVSPSGPLTYSVTSPEKPTVMSQSPLPKGACGISYSFSFEADSDPAFTEWDVSSGALPEGIELMSDGDLSGIPTEYGVFTFSVTASVLGASFSDPAEFTLEILEKPVELVLVQDSTYSFASDDGIKYLSGVKELTNVKTVISNFESPEYISVFDADGNVKSPSDIVGTGFTVKLMDGSTVMDSATVIVLGDVSGDGRIATIDYQRIRAYYLGNYEMSGAHLRAAHVAGNERVATIDYQRVRAHYLGTYDIFA